MFKFKAGKAGLKSDRTNNVIEIVVENLEVIAHRGKNNNFNKNKITHNNQHKLIGKKER